MAVQETTSRPAGGESVEERPRGGELDAREVELDEPIADGEAVVEAELGRVCVHGRRGLAVVGDQALDKGPEAKRGSGAPASSSPVPFCELRLHLSNRKPHACTTAN
uniref:DUF834 domain-containing protein n=1 Tax=Oryza glumipatula TaxID=40148 RepID=A0A0E0AC72_9ORYZ